MASTAATSALRSPWGSYGAMGFFAIFAGGLDFAFGAHVGLIVHYEKEADWGDFR
jgi:hypothetical protein